MKEENKIETTKQKGKTVDYEKIEFQHLFSCVDSSNIFQGLATDKHWNDIVEDYLSEIDNNALL